LNIIFDFGVLLCSFYFSSLFFFSFFFFFFNLRQFEDIIAFVEADPDYERCKIKKRIGENSIYGMNLDSVYLTDGDNSYDNNNNDGDDDNVNDNDDIKSVV
jgi:hypothetical protein